MNAAAGAVTGQSGARDAFDRMLAELRPKLHRYCARMTGSVIDGEDVVQEALAKAIEAFAAASPIANPEGWLFHVAHNTALDFLRRRSRLRLVDADERLDTVVDPLDVVEQRQFAATSLATFMRLPARERSSVILMDVLGYSLAEIGEMMNTSLPAVKAVLHRGRARLRDLAARADERPSPVLAEADRRRLAAYIDRFNARDFDAIRNMLSDEARLDIVATRRLRGKREATTYFSNYSSRADWQFVPGLVEGRPAAIVRDPADPAGTILYFVLLEWAGEFVTGIRDFRHARYVAEAAEVVRLG